MESEKNELINEAILQEKKRELQLDEAFELTNAVSVTDCTGSMPVAPETNAQKHHYEESYHFEPVAVKKEINKKYDE